MDEEDSSPSTSAELLKLSQKAKPISLTPGLVQFDSMLETTKTKGVDGKDQTLNTGMEISTSTPAKSKKDVSPLEATFTDPKDCDQNSCHHKSKGCRKKAEYRALEVASSSSHTNTDSLTISITTEDDNKHLTGKYIKDDETVLSALGVLLMCVLGPLWALGVAYWHYRDGQLTASLVTLTILALSIFIVDVAYLAAKHSPKKKIWNSSKIIWGLCAIPGCTSPMLGLCDCIFAIRESQSRSYERPWRNTKYVYLVESLALAFPLSVFHLLRLAEDPDSLPSVKGYFFLISVSVFSFFMAFSRYRYDAENQPDRFGSRLENLIRFVTIWSTKILWMLTLSLLLVCLRIALPHHKTVTIVGGVALMFLLHEIPVVCLMSPLLKSAAMSLITPLMMIPQAVSLSVLIVWVNIDQNVYFTDIGCCILGMFFWSEAIILAGWLYDRCTGRDVDVLPYYPHFFADIAAGVRNGDGDTD